MPWMRCGARTAWQRCSVTLVTRLPVLLPFMPCLPSWGMTSRNLHQITDCRSDPRTDRADMSRRCTWSVADIMRGIVAAQPRCCLCTCGSGVVIARAAHRLPLPCIARPHCCCRRRRARRYSPPPGAPWQRALAEAPATTDRPSGRAAGPQAPAPKSGEPNTPAARPLRARKGTGEGDARAAGEGAGRAGTSTARGYATAVAPDAERRGDGEPRAARRRLMSRFLTSERSFGG